MKPSTCVSSNARRLWLSAMLIVKMAIKQALLIVLSGGGLVVHTKIGETHRLVITGIGRSAGMY